MLVAFNTDHHLVNPQAKSQHASGSDIIELL